MTQSMNTAAPALEVATEERNAPSPNLPKPIPLFARSIDEWLKLTGVAYAVGFLVIMAHTARLHVPVVEAFHFQNVIAGLPVCLAFLLGYLLWPILKRRIQGQADKKIAMNRTGLLFLICCILVGGFLFYLELQKLFDLKLSGLQKAEVLFGGVLAVSLSILVQMLRSPRSVFGRETGVVLSVVVYGAMLGLVFEYAYLVYPHLSQSVGGGRPVPVTLLLKDRQLAGVLGATPDAHGVVASTADVMLFYRTTSYVLVRRADSQPLVQVPADQILAVTWLQSDR